jgi:hypothetical protein
MDYLCNLFQSELLLLFPLASWKSRLPNNSMLFQQKWFPELTVVSSPGVTTKRQRMVIELKAVARHAFKGKLQRSVEWSNSELGIIMRRSVSPKSIIVLVKITELPASTVKRDEVFEPLLWAIPNPLMPWPMAVGDLPVPRRFDLTYR